MESSESPSGLALSAGIFVLSNSSCKSGIAVSPSLEPGLVWRCDVDAAEFASAVVFISSLGNGQLGVLSTYFPDILKPVSEFTQAVRESWEVLKQFVSMDVKGCVLCCDLNKQVPADLDRLNVDAEHSGSLAKFQEREAALFAQLRDLTWR